MQSPIAWDADEPKFDGGPETHAFRDEAFAEAMRKPSNPPPLRHQKKPPRCVGFFADSKRKFAAINALRSGEAKGKA